MDNTIIVGNKAFGTIEEANEFYDEIFDYIYQSAFDKTPVDTGRLISSYRVVRYGTQPNERYLENFCDYAIYVHEIIENEHPLGGQAKFLEDAGYEAETRFDVKCYMELTAEFIRIYVDDDKHGFSVSGSKPIDTKQDEIMQLLRKYWKMTMSESGELGQVIQDIRNNKQFSNKNISQYISEIKPIDLEKIFGKTDRHFNVEGYHGWKQWTEQELRLQEALMVIRKQTKKGIRPTMMKFEELIN